MSTLSRRVLSLLLVVVCQHATAGTLDLKFNPPDIDLPGVNAGDLTGRKVAVCDFNGDGRGDLVIGAPDHDYAGRSNCGAVYIVLTDDTTTTPVDLADERPDIKRIFGPLASSRLGSVVVCGDVNGDGRDDIVCGVPTAEANGKLQAGEVWVVYGSAQPPDTTDLASPPGAVSQIQGAATFDKLGTSIAIGWIDGDAYGDLLIGAPLASAPGLSFSGMAYIIYGGQNPDSVIDIASTTWPLVAVYAESSGDFFGNACVLADINGDTYSDMIIGAPQAQPLGRSAAGITYVIPGGPSLSSPVDVAAMPTGITRVFGAANSLSGSQAAAGQVWGGSGLDVIIAAPEFSPPGRTTAGAVYVIENQPNPPDTIDLAAGPAGTSRIDGPVAGLKMGSALAVGDMNVDGFDETAIGIPNLTHTSRPEAGQVSIVFGRSAWPAVIDLAVEQSGITTLLGDHTDDNTGSSVAFGDVDTDAFADLFIGASGSNVSGQVATGRAMLIYGDQSLTPTYVRSYDAYVADRRVRLEWTVLDDADPAGFEVRRSGGGSAAGVRLDALVIRAGSNTYTLEDASVSPGQSYAYTVATREPEYRVLFELTVFVPQASLASLYPAFPNPFTTATTIALDLPHAGTATVRVYDVAGRLVAELSDGPLAAGTTQLRWDGRTRAGTPAAAGTYFVRMAFAHQRLTRKVVLVR